MKLARSVVLAVLGAWVVLLASACASKKIDWASRVGSYSYDDAVRELGPPDKAAQLTDGSTVADWLTARGMQTASAYGPPYPAYGRYGRYGWGGPGFVVVDPPSPDRFLRLTFDPRGKLASWQKVYR